MNDKVSYVNRDSSRTNIIVSNDQIDNFCLIFRRYSPLFDVTIFLSQKEGQEFIEALKEHVVEEAK